MSSIKYCPHCQQNVNVITRPTNTALVLCFFGFPLLVSANTLSNPWYFFSPGLTFISLVLLFALYKFLVIIGWIVGIISLLTRRSYCPICRIPVK